ECSQDSHAESALKIVTPPRSRLQSFTTYCTIFAVKFLERVLMTRLAEIKRATRENIIEKQKRYDARTKVPTMLEEDIAKREREMEAIRNVKQRQKRAEVKQNKNLERARNDSQHSRLAAGGIRLTLEAAERLGMGSPVVNDWAGGHHCLGANHWCRPTGGVAWGSPSSTTQNIERLDKSRKQCVQKRRESASGEHVARHLAAQSAKQRLQSSKAARAPAFDFPKPTSSDAKSKLRPTSAVDERLNWDGLPKYLNYPDFAYCHL
ncbi:hypothetical protein CYMTET_35306, partial [Cymbomonas tetramitiformis]